jgi:hypothetical protein
MPIFIRFNEGGGLGCVGHHSSAAHSWWIRDTFSKCLRAHSRFTVLQAAAVCWEIAKIIERIMPI